MMMVYSYLLSFAGLAVVGVASRFVLLQFAMPNPNDELSMSTTRFTIKDRANLFGWSLLVAAVGAAILLALLITGAPIATATLVLLYVVGALMLLAGGYVALRCKRKQLSLEGDQLTYRPVLGAERTARISELEAARETKTLNVPTVYLYKDGKLFCLAAANAAGYRFLVQRLKEEGVPFRPKK